MSSAGRVALMTISSIESAVTGITRPLASRSRRHGARRLIMFGAAGLVALAGVIGLGRGGNWLGVTLAGSELLTYDIQPIDLDITVLESGTLESASSLDVLSTVEGQVAIIGLLPEGSAVRKGDVVVELESSPLKTRRTEQQIVVE